MTTEQAYQAAVECHRAGKLREAYVWYHQVLHARPDHAHAHNDLGILAHQLGKHELARESISRALELLPEEPSFHCNAAKVLGALGEIDRAIDHCRRAI